MRALVFRALCASFALGVLAVPARAQDSTAKEEAWYDRLSIRGYGQFRYNRLLETNEKLECSTCDRSIGENGGFLLRRARLIVSGRITDRISMSFQSDFASEVGGRENTAVLRHYYADIYLDSAKTIRARIGQSEVPTGFEAVQSSSRRAPFDRADAMESAAPGEQDLGVFFTWTPPGARQRLRDLATNRFKGTGDFGVVAVGAYNGQGGNRAEMNDEPHVVARIAYPFALGSQTVELGGYAYTGTYTIASSQRASGVGGEDDFDDRRAGGFFSLYPKPIGVQAEWTVGRGPRYDVETNAITDQPVRGGYVMLSYPLLTGRHQLFAYTRAQYFTGSFKTDPDARASVVHEYEPGLEWSLGSSFELTAAYTFADRFYRDSATPHNDERGRFLRLQAQFNF
jgi:hypothetical protein